jgi:hypothetical protein
MKKIMALLTLCGAACLVLYARDTAQQGSAEGESCSIEAVNKMKEGVDQAQSRCDNAKDDPYEDAVCGRSEMKIRRERRKLEKCAHEREKGIQRYGNEE